MNNLYDVVKDVVNAPSMDEANSILFGTEGISVNSKEYYETIVANFIKKKEVIIRKDGTNLIFDLDNVNDLWSCVFIGEYVRHEIEEMEDTINNQLVSIQNDIINIEKEYKIGIIDGPEKGKRMIKNNSEKRMLREKLNNLLSCKTAFFDQTYSLRVKLENSTGVKERDLEIIKEDIKSIHVIRNSIQHGKSEMATIENYNTEIKIPIEYLDGFSKGRIIADDEDKVIVEKANYIVSPVLENLGYDIKKIDSFFYNVDPDWLSFLLEQVDYDYDKLFQLKEHMFIYGYAVEELLDSGWKFDDIKQLPDESLFNVKNILSLIKNLSIEEIIQLPAEAYENPDFIVELLNKIPFSVIKQLPGEAFLSPDKTRIFIKKVSLDTLIKIPETLYYETAESIELLSTEQIEHFVKMAENNYNIYIEEDDDSDFDITRFELDMRKFTVRNVYNELDCISDSSTKIRLSETSLFHAEAAREFSKMLPFEVINQLPDGAFLNINSTYELLKKLPIEIVKELPCGAFKKPKNTIQLLDVLSIETIKELPDGAFISIDNTLKLLKLLSINIVKKLPDKAFTNVDITMKLLELLSINIVKELPDGAFISIDNTLKLLEGTSMDNVKKLPAYAFEFPENTLKILKHLSIDVIRNLSKEAFCNQEIIDRVIDLIDTSDEEFYLFMLNNPLISIEFLDSGLPIDCIKIVLKKYGGMNIKIDNVKYLLNIVNNDYNKLNQFPAEFFTCNISLIDEMYETYNTNVARSIFGIKNPKIIGSLIYCNSVFKNYDGVPEIYNEIDLSANEFMNMCLSDIYQYSNNFGKKRNNNFMNQFLLDDNGNFMDSLSMKKKILKKIRNSSAHFRFKPVKDENGNIVPDKVYLYDKFDELDTTNFDIIIDVKNLVKFSRIVELGINLSETKSELSNIEKEVDSSSKEFYESYERGNRIAADEALEKWDDALKKHFDEEVIKKDLEDKISHVR